MENSPDSVKDSSSSWADIRLIATDMDGTLTDQGLFTAALLTALTQLADAGLTTWIVTGRSAGWVQGVVAYLPIMGAIAENGGVFIPKATLLPEYLVEIPAVTQHRQQLAAVFRQIQQHFPDLQPSADNPFRLTDWTFDIGQLSPDDLTHIDQSCQAAGWGFTYSTVQCHIRPAEQEKGRGLQQVLNRDFPTLSPQQLVTVGDSPNDESLFDPQRFPCSVGVANLAHYQGRLRYWPTQLLSGREVQGFQELVAMILAARQGL